MTIQQLNSEISKRVDDLEAVVKNLRGGSFPNLQHRINILLDLVVDFEAFVVENLPVDETNKETETEKRRRVNGGAAVA